MTLSSTSTTSIMLGHSEISYAPALLVTTLKLETIFYAHLEVTSWCRIPIRLRRIPISPLLCIKFIKDIINLGKNSNRVRSLVINSRVPNPKILKFIHCIFTITAFSTNNTAAIEDCTPFVLIIIKANIPCATG